MRMDTSCFRLLALILLVGAGGCGKGAGIDPNRTAIAVIPKGTTHVFWKSIHAGAVKASRELDVDIIWKGPLKEDDREGQIAVVEHMIQLGVKGIVLAPLDDTALRAPVAQARQTGIPVVIIDSGLKSDDFVSFVATDNYLGGVKAGGAMLGLLHDRGKRVVVLRYQEGSASTEQRERGFLDTIAKNQAGVRVASSNQYGGATTESAYRASENLLAPYKKDGGLTVDGIFCPNESTTFGMLRALQDAGLAGKVAFVGFDSSELLVAGLEKGEIAALVLQDPFKMGYLGVKTMVEHLKGGKVPKRVDTGVYLVNRHNMKQPDTRELLAPDFKKWLE